MRCVGVAAVVLVAGTSYADDIDSETFRSTPAVAAQTFHVEPADVGESGAWIATTVVSFASNPLAVDTSIGGSSIAEDQPVARRGMLELAGAYAFGGRFEAGLRVPLFAQRGDSPDASTFHVPAADGFALGDITLNGRALVYADERLSAGAALHVTLPTSSEGQFVGTDGPTGRALVLATWRAHPLLSVYANAGAVVRQLSTYSNSGEVPQGAIEISQGSGGAWGVGANLPATEALRITAEMFGEVITRGDTMNGYATPIDALVGVRYQLDNGLVFGAAVGRGITSELGTPDVRGVVAIAFVPSRAVASAPIARAPEEPAPPPVVAGKAIPSDSRDRCPFEAEDMDGFEDSDGCADADNDRDLIVDAQDKCPNEAEVINGVDDKDGCPDVGDTTTMATGAQSALQAAEQAFMQGRELMKQKKYAAACASFETSQRLDPQFGTQFNLAGCYVEVGKLATAWTMYRELARADQNAERRKQAGDAARKLDKRVPKLRIAITSPPQGLQVFMNGANASLLVGVDTPLDFGSYELSAGAPGFTPWRKTVQINEEGKVVTVTIKLEAVTP